MELDRLQMRAASHAESLRPGLVRHAPLRLGDREVRQADHPEPHECDSAYAAWQGFTSPLRHVSVPSTCLAGEHGLFWRVEALDPESALALLPRFVAERTTPIEVREVEIP